MISCLLESGVSEQQVALRTGHRSSESLKSYHRPSDGMKKEQTSSILNIVNDNIIKEVSKENSGYNKYENYLSPEDVQILGKKRKADQLFLDVFNNQMDVFKQQNTILNQQNTILAAKFKL